MNRKEFVTIAKEAFHKWQSHNATLRAAALAFFIVLPLPSILLITVTVYGQFYGQAQGSQQFIEQIGAFAGPTIKSLVSQLLQSEGNPFTLSFGSFISVVFAVAGAIGAFAVLQDTFDVLWEVELPRKRSLKTRVRERSIPFLLVLGAALVVVGWLEFTSLLFTSINYGLGQAIGTFAASAALFTVQILFSFAVATLLFSIVFKEIPDVQIKWSDVWLGAIMTALIFTILNNLIGFYLRTFPVTSVAGAAGSLIILLIWVFIVCEVLLYGAQFSKCHAEIIGSHSETGEEHKHEVKQSASGKIIEKIISTENEKEQRAESQTIKNQSVPSKFEPDREKETQIVSAKEEQTVIPGEAESLSALPKKAESENSTEDERGQREANPQVSYSETESSDKSEKEYDLRLKWKKKKRSLLKNENSANS